MTLLLIKLPGDNGHEVLWPWEQDAELQRAVLLHTAACRLCLLDARPMFGTDVPKSTFNPGCADGIVLSRDLRAFAAAKRASK
jgi:hypothetical protein